MSFIPQFNSDLYEYGPMGDTHLNPRLWLTQTSAYQLADLLVDLKPVVVMGYPWFTAPHSPFGFNTKVPMFKFPSGYTENPGAYAIFWVQQPDQPEIALRYCKAQIASDEAYWLANQ